MIGIKRQTHKYNDQAKQLKEFNYWANTIKHARFILLCRRLANAIDETNRLLFNLNPNNK